MYEAVIDAGSSGTRIFLYEIDPGPYPSIKLVTQQEFSITPSGKKEDGLNNFIDPHDPELLNQACSEVIIPLLNSIYPYLAQQKIAAQDVVINLFATAGMRYAERHFGSAAVKQLYELIHQCILENGFQAGEIRTSDGNREEGLWSWINLNDMHRDIFQSDNPPLGVLEVGGSSAQFSFPVECETVDDQAVHLVSINNRHFQVFSKTYLGLGQDDARKKMRENLGSSSSAVCYPKGFPATSDKGDTLDGFGKLQLKADGNYQFEACFSAYDNIIANISTHSPLPNLHQCSFDFVGIDAIYHALKFWDLQDKPSQLGVFIESFDHDHIHFESIHTNEYTQAQSANATYIHALLYGNNGILRKNPEKLISAIPNKSSDGKLLTWTRGFLLEKHAK